MMCKDCKYGTGNGFSMWCARHSPIAVANPNYKKGFDDRIVLSEQPPTHPECSCGDFEQKEKE
ncbi:hypothetical protein LCGC14_0659780 [marine sediment metagenome]|uniref:Uncharacterized protein n=1 Tax=marine sediment metagenome TaxID=412755 RepID=A0A0F9QYZ5_9ZZZZ